MRAVELFSGIGAFGVVAARRGIEIAAAFDQNELANEAYRANLGLQPLARAIESLRPQEIPDADLWWASPPCQPFTRRGRGRDDEDPRSRALLRLIGWIERGEAEPRRAFLLENVPEFAGSRSHERLVAALAARGFETRELDLCPTSFGVPMRRRRLFIVAIRGPRFAPPPLPGPSLARLDTFLDPRFAGCGELRLDPALRERYRHALDLVDSRRENAVLACFTRAYGSSPVRSGSYLLEPDGGARRIHPDEILRLLGFPPEFRFPNGWSLARRWRLVGNTVDIRAIEHLLAAVHLPTSTSAR